jgi:hypothetical protein
METIEEKEERANEENEKQLKIEMKMKEVPRIMGTSFIHSIF